MNGINRNVVLPINDDDSSYKSHLPDDQETWIRNFNTKCLAISERKCSQKLDELMELYIRKMRREMNNYGPFAASSIVHRMNKTMLIFYLFHQDINEFFEISQWTRNMVEIISLYCQLELRAAQRRRPGQEADLLACRRIMAVLWSYLQNDQECMIHILLKMPNVGRKHKHILDPIYRKLLLNQKGKNLTELEYIRNVFAFKLWKRLYGVEEKKAISEMALCELSAPKTLTKNYWNYKFLPQNINPVDIHNVLITAMFDIQIAIKGYFDHLENTPPVVIEVIDLTSEEVQTVSNDARPFNEGLHNYSSKTVCASNIDQLDDDFLSLEEAELIEIDPEELTDTFEKIETPVWCASLMERAKEIRFSEAVINEVSETKKDSQDVEVSEVDEFSGVGEVSEVDEVSKVNEVSEVDETSKVNEVRKENEVSKANEVRNKENQETQTSKDNFVQQMEKMTTAEISHEKGILSNCVPENVITRLPQTMDTGTDAQPISKLQITNVRRASSDSESDESDKNAQLSEDNSSGMREISSTSHPTKDDDALRATTVPDSPCYEQVDSTSNLLESGPEEQQYRRDLNNQQISQQYSITNECNALRVTDSRRHANNIECNVVRVMSSNNSTSDTFNGCTRNEALLTNAINDDENSLELDVGTETDFNNKPSQLSPADSIQAAPVYEPISKNDKMEFIEELQASKFYQNAYKQHATNHTDSFNISTSRDVAEPATDQIATPLPPSNTRPLNQVIRTYQKRTRKSVATTNAKKTTSFSVSCIDAPVEKERRVPENGEKILRFENGLNTFAEKYKLSKMDYMLLNPNVWVTNKAPDMYCADQGSTSYVADALGLTDNDYFLGFERPQNMKKIVEKHEYLKDGEKNPRVRVIKVREDTSQAEQDDEDQPQQRSRKRQVPRNMKPTPKRGTINSDFNINLTVSPVQSLLLNSSFQHHFCSDIATCRKSKCYPEQQQLQLDFSAASTSQTPLHILPPIPTIHHLTPPPLTAMEPQNLSVSVMGFNPPILTAVAPLPPPPLSPAVQDLSHASSVPKPEMAPPILPAEVPYWHEIKSSKPQVCDHSQTSCPNVLVNINVGSCNSADDEIHLPIKKRRVSSINASVSSLKVAIEDKLSYPATPMISIADLITYERERGRPFRTLAEMKEFPRIPDPYSEPIVPDPPQPNESGSSQNPQDIQNPHITYTTLEERLYPRIHVPITVKHHNCRRKRGCRSHKHCTEHAVRTAAGKSRSSKQK